MMKHYILYIPGLGDGYDRYRRKALQLWSLFGVEAQLLPMSWYDGRPYADKYNQASEHIAALLTSGAKVSLVGESAGGSMAINLFARHPAIASLVTIAGVNEGATPVARKTLQRGPAFATSRQFVDESLAMVRETRRQEIYTLSALSDMVVTARHSRIPGAHNRRILSIGHVWTIALCLTVFSGYVISLAKKSNSV